MNTYIKDALIIASFAVLYLCAVTSQSHAMGLKENVVIEGNVITLGDIFYDLPYSADKVLGPAPRPGSDMVLNARTLMRVAMALDLPWRPTNSAEQVILRRAATLISVEDIKNQLKHDLESEGYDHNIELDFSSETSEIVLPEDQPASFDITELDIDKTRNWFTATIMAPSKSNAIYTNKISGKIHRMIDVPVLRETMRSGTIIGKNDIEYIKMRERELSPQMLIDTKVLMGTTPRRIIFAGRPITDGDVESPQIVARGDTVTIVLKNGTMMLTASGRSLENGAKGDLVRVTNASSNRTVQGIVTAEKEITLSEF